MELLKQNASCRVWRVGDEVVKEYLPAARPSPSRALQQELAAVKRLQRVSVPHVRTPVVRSVDRRACAWRQDFVPSTPFYTFLARYYNPFVRDARVRGSIASLGEYLGKLHAVRATRPLVHGDLSYHNIRFLPDGVFLLDPGWAPLAPLSDLAKLLLNFEPFHPLGLLVSRRDWRELQRILLRAYESAAGPVDRAALRRNALAVLRRDRRVKQRGILYRAKKQLINLLSKRLERRILKGQALNY